MWEERRLSSPGKSVTVGLDYIARDRARRRIIAKIFELSMGTTAGGAPRVRMRLREEGASQQKTFISSRLTLIFDPVTGEVLAEDDAAMVWIAQALDAELPPFWPVERLRTTDIPVTFDAEGYAEGWFFGVSAAFRDALDIVWTKTQVTNIDPHTGKKYKRELEAWTRGMPPAYSFSEFDVAYAPPLREALKSAAWAEQQRAMTFAVSVVEALPDLAVDRRVSPGQVKINLQTYLNGEIINQEQIELSQSQFVTLLKEGPQSLGSE
jgi:hypothetical protein